MSAPAHSRRRLLAAGAASASDLAGAALSGRPAPIGPPFGGGDTGILQGAIRLERSVAVAYAVIAESGLLPADEARAARVFRDQESAHADALTVALEALGEPPPAPPTADDLPALGALRSRRDALALLSALERRLLDNYYEAERRLERATLIRMVAQIMANEGQHLLVLRRALGEAPAPSAFEDGRA